MVNEIRLVDLFLKLCLFNAPPLQERGVIDWTKAYLENLGLKVSEDDAGSKIGGNAGNITATLPGNLPNAASTQT